MPKKKKRKGKKDPQEVPPGTSKTAGATAPDKDVPTSDPKGSGASSSKAGSSDPKRAQAPVGVSTPKPERMDTSGEGPRFAGSASTGALPKIPKVRILSETASAKKSAPVNPPSSPTPPSQEDVEHFQVVHHRRSKSRSLERAAVQCPHPNCPECLAARAAKGKRGGKGGPSYPSRPSGQQHPPASRGGRGGRGRNPPTTSQRERGQEPTSAPPAAAAQSQYGEHPDRSRKRSSPVTRQFEPEAKRQYDELSFIKRTLPDSIATSYAALEDVRKAAVPALTLRADTAWRFRVVQSLEQLRVVEPLFITTAKHFGVVGITSLCRKYQNVTGDRLPRFLVLQTAFGWCLAIDLAKPDFADRDFTKWIPKAFTDLFANPDILFLGDGIELWLQDEMRDVFVARYVPFSNFFNDEPVMEIFPDHAKILRKRNITNTTKACVLLYGYDFETYDNEQQYYQVWGSNHPWGTTYPVYWNSELKEYSWMKRNKWAAYVFTRTILPIAYLCRLVQLRDHAKELSLRESFYMVLQQHVFANTQAFGGKPHKAIDVTLAIAAQWAAREKRQQGVLQFTAKDRAQQERLEGKKFTEVVSGEPSKTKREKTISISSSNSSSSATSERVTALESELKAIRERLQRLPPGPPTSFLARAAFAGETAEFARDYVDDPRICRICGDFRHPAGRDCPNQHPEKGGLQICTYDLCDSLDTHLIATCPALHHTCNTCHHRGHFEDKCHRGINSLFQKRFATFQEYRDKGLLTFLAKDEYNPGWGFFPVPMWVSGQNLSALSRNVKAYLQENKLPHLRHSVEMSALVDLSIREVASRQQIDINHDKVQLYFADGDMQDIYVPIAMVEYEAQCRKYAVTLDEKAAPFPDQNVDVAAMLASTSITTPTSKQPLITPEKVAAVKILESDDQTMSTPGRMRSISISSTESENPQPYRGASSSYVPTLNPLQEESDPARALAIKQELTEEQELQKKQEKWSKLCGEEKDLFSARYPDLARLMQKQAEATPPLQTSPRADAPAVRRGIACGTPNQGVGVETTPPKTPANLPSTSKQTSGQAKVPPPTETSPQPKASTSEGSSSDTMPLSEERRAELRAQRQERKRAAKLAKKATQSELKD